MIDFQESIRVQAIGRDKRPSTVDVDSRVGEGSSRSPARREFLATFPA